MSKKLTTQTQDQALAIAEELGIRFNAMDSVERPELPKIQISRETKMFLIGDDEAIAKEIEGHILWIANARAYWTQSYDETGGGQAPDCWAVDTTVPTGENVQNESCVSCPHNQFGSDKHGVGKACRQRKRFLVKMDDSLLPYILDIPPLGIRAVERFCTNYSAKYRLPLPLARVRITLAERVSKRTGQKGTEPVFEVLSTNVDMEKAREIKKLMDTFVQQAKETSIVNDEGSPGSVDPDVPF